MSYINPFNNPFTGTGSDDTPAGALIRSGGKHVSKTITLNANATQAKINVFQLTGACVLKSLHGEVIGATVLTNCTSVYFDLWDGTLSIPLTKTTTASLSGLGVGTFFIKDADVATALTVLSNATTAIKEGPTGAKVSTDVAMVQKRGVNTYIRFVYTTTDAPINAQVKVDATYADIDNGEIVSV